MASVEKQLLERCSAGDHDSVHTLLDNNQPASPDLVNQLLAATIASGQIYLAKSLLSRYPDISLLMLPVREATDTASIPLFQVLYEKDPSIVHMEFEREGTPLALAAMCGRPIEFISYLLSCGANPNQPPSIIPFPVASAIFGYKGSTEVAMLLLKNGAKLQHTGALCMAASRGYLEAVQFLLEHGATPATDQREDGIPDLTGIGPALNIAVYKGHLEIVDLLLKHGADISQKNRDGKTALDIAEEKGYTQILDLLRGHKNVTTTTSDN
ncbi:ankyrin repeat protein [Histoplasma capsulatum G186AR]|uniref:Ankyrin repeat protein n=2 Tax=Ajellomyces capsulatus TaxID=5037 RepID=C0NS83_AJECG|nr:ankyrin repeat protein [Histoplasma capsulatum G186AR]EEH05749.1 ankyrin repeat protein [Histoplasma capsulatum G186AR]KAG5300093.1 ankyrin repeat protein [Histoplasma capsulatum]QSS67276.1 ankyrin repeat protein [Histoplasma capsulatum G186AR]